MDINTRKKMEALVERLCQEDPIRLGTALYEPGDRRILRLRLAYQRKLLMKVASKFPEVPLIEAVSEVIAPACH